MTLIERFGWSSFFESRFRPFEAAGLVPARVLREERESCSRRRPGWRDASPRRQAVSGTSRRIVSISQPWATGSP